ncbi:MAG TPA: hypothetical protein VGP44_02535 [Gemmatimonadales bacterium]|nr:hypothetical protein [Gemmatimonadales bacterium]
MIEVQQWAEIRRMKLVDGLSIRAIERRTGLHRKTIRRALTSPEPPTYRPREATLQARASPSRDRAAA